MRGVTTSYRHLAAGAALALAAGAVQAATSEWWDNDWGLRRNVAVSTGPVAPDKGYAGYTAPAARANAAPAARCR
ncbi:MAG: hypothetical protein AAFV30_04630 [Pseudomonadota bacterium]